MERSMRKKSTSSDSELSDGWTVVEPLVEKPMASDPQQTSEPNRTTDSDADSVDIIESDSDTGVVNIDSTMAFKDSIGQSSDTCGDKWIVKQYSTQCLDTTHSRNLLKNWFKIIGVFSLLCILVISSSMAVITLQGKLFALKLFEDSSKYVSDNEIALLAELNFFKRENQKLKEEVEFMKIEINEARLQSLKPAFTEDDKNVNGKWGIDLEVISLGSEDMKPFKTFRPPYLFNEGTETEKTNQNDDSYLPKPSVLEMHREKLSQLKNMVNNVTSSTTKVWKNINRYLENIMLLVSHVDTNKHQYPDKSNAVRKVQNKLSKFLVNLENDFGKAINRVSKRIFNFHDDLLSKVCLTGNNIFDCSSTKQPPMTSKIEKMFKDDITVENDVSTDSTPSKIFFNDVPTEYDPYSTSFKRNLEKEPKEKHKSKRSTKKDLKDEMVNDPHLSYIGINTDMHKPNVFKSKKQILIPDYQESNFNVKKTSGTKSQDLLKRNKKFHKIEYPYSKKQGCKKKSGSKDVKSEITRMKYKNHNGSFHYSKSLSKHMFSNGDGLWYLDIGENRARKRSVNTKSDWLFDRYRLRRALRNEAKWALNRASMREFCRINGQYPWCSMSKII